MLGKGSVKWRVVNSNYLIFISVYHKFQLGYLFLVIVINYSDTFDDSLRILLFYFPFTCYLNVINCPSYWF